MCSSSLASRNAPRLNGFTYLECVVAMAVVGICALILFSSFQVLAAHRKRADLQARAISALSSQADMIRTGAAPRDPGVHAFLEKGKLLQGLPRGKAQYAVSRVAEVPRLLRVKLRVEWMDPKRRLKELEIFVHE